MAQQLRASTQYNDFTGTSAADESDHVRLGAYLASRGVDTQRFVPIGARFYAGYASIFLPAIVCIDATRSTPEKPYLVKIDVWDGEMTRNDFFNLFKRMEVEFTVLATSFQEAQRNAPMESMDIKDLINDAEAED